MTPFEIFEKKWEFWSKRREINGGFFHWFLIIDQDTKIRKYDMTRINKFYKPFHVIRYKTLSIHYKEDRIEIVDVINHKTYSYEYYVKKLAAKRVSDEIKQWIENGSN